LLLRLRDQQEEGCALVHPLYDEYLGGRREFQEDEVDHGSDFPGPLDVDYIFFDADRDRAFASYLWREIMIIEAQP